MYVCLFCRFVFVGGVATKNVSHVTHINESRERVTYITLPLPPVFKFTSPPPSGRYLSVSDSQGRRHYKELTASDVNLCVRVNTCIHMYVSVHPY